MFGQDNTQNQSASADSTNGFVPPIVHPHSAGVYPTNDTASNPATPPLTSSPSSSHGSPTSAPPAHGANSQELIDLKHEALQQLTPLVSHLEQSPEEKFRTVMMMIQATDDHTKLKEAFDAAKQISDDKVRAQALLDVINEINYFTQQNS